MLHSPLKKLENEIRDCEARVRLHDTRLVHSLHLLRDSALQAGSSKLVWAGGAALGGALGLFWTRRRPKARTRRWLDAEERAYRRKKRRRESLPDQLHHWGPLLLPLLTPLLNRKVALSLGQFGLPVNVRPHDPLPAVKSLDLARYAGRWYEIARLPTRDEKDCARDVSVEYTPDADGGVKVHNRCVHADGRPQEAEGRLRVRDTREPGQAEVSFAPSLLHWWPGAWGDYWVLFVDNDYQVSLVGTPDRDKLWVLSRASSMETADLEALKSLALRHGFDSTRLILTRHSSGSGAELPNALPAVEAAHLPADARPSAVPRAPT